MTIDPEHILGIQLAEHLEARLAGDQLLNTVLTDPAYCPEVYAKLTAEREELYVIQRQGRGAQYVPPDYHPHSPWETGRTALLKFPGDRRIFVCRNNADRLAAYFAAQGVWGMCDVCVAEDCMSQTLDDHPTRPLPIACGRVVIMFEICQACEFAVTDKVYFNLRANVLAAQADLPPGAVIDPGSPIPPQP